MNSEIGQIIIEAAASSINQTPPISPRISKIPYTLLEWSNSIELTSRLQTKKGPL